MAIVSYLDDGAQMAKAFVNKNYSNIHEIIEDTRESITYCIREGELLAGYNVTVNKALSRLYDMNFYVIKLLFRDVDTLHSEGQCLIIEQLFKNLKSHIEKNKGYYNLRLPSHIVDVIKANNKILPCGVFCGGTIEEIIYGKKIDFSANDVDVLIADDEYIQKNRDYLLSIAFESFKNYQGHYHISDITQYKAGEIYRNWLRDSLDFGCGNVVAEYCGNPAGFATINETENSIEGVLTAVDVQYRKKGVYKSMIAYIINMAESKGKSFTISTQFDNYIVQGVWGSMGLVPYYSIYNFHINS